MYEAQKKALAATSKRLFDGDANGSTSCEYDIGAMLLDALNNASTRCAYRFQGAELTRNQFREEVLALAARLQDAGVRPGAPVAIEIEHSLELAVAICGVQVVGACAVPIDPDVSVERRDAILADIRPAFALKRGTPCDSDTRIAVDIDCRATPGQNHNECDPDLAFIVYTSGSSGTPKGVMITKESYVRRMRHIVPSISPSDDDIDLAWTPSSFIAMVDEFFLPLLCEVPTVIADPGIRSDPRAFKALVQQEGVTTFRITPSLLNVLMRSGAADALSKVRTIICSGETMPAELTGMVHRQLSASVIGFYGATEAPAAAYSEFDRDAPPSDTTICTPQPFLTLRIVREDGTEAAVGEVGEIWIGGCAVARGYYRRPELTAAKFVERDGERWFRTGDRGQRLEGGKVEVLGRADLSEVNIHGVRISIPEIRDALCNLEDVEDAWVSMIDYGAVGHDPVLVGHCIPRDGLSFDPTEARAELALRLPMLAVPRVLLVHDQFPLTANGKLDAQRLARDAREYLDDSARRPRRKPKLSTGSPTETAILNCFEQALDKRFTSLDQNFFDTGGTSLEAVVLACLVSDHFKTEIGFEEIWMYPSPQELSALIDRRAKGNSARSFFHVEGTSGPNLFAIGFGVSHLSGMWPNRRLLVNPGISGDPRVSLRKRLSEYVAEYVEGVRLIQPSGPYQLIGFSFSGLIAYEVARTLHEEGETIQGLALIEPVTPTTNKSTRHYGLTALSEIAKSVAGLKLSRTHHLLRLVKNSLISANSRPNWRQLSAYGNVVIAAERLKPCDVPVDLIYGDACPEEILEKWQAVAQSNLRLSKIASADHQSLITRESVQQWQPVVDRWAG